MLTGDQIFAFLLWGLTCYLFASAMTRKDFELELERIENKWSDMLAKERLARDQLAKEFRSLAGGRGPDTSSSRADLAADKKVTILK